MALRPLPHLQRMLPATARAMSSQALPAKDWSAAQYLRFGSERTRPARDLLAQVPLDSPRRVIDIGCGPGNSTEVLAARFPSAQILGIDSSPDMIATATRALPGLQFHVADVTSFAPEQPADLFYSNAVLHWIPRDDRLPLIQRLVRTLSKGGVFAMQVPDNHAEPSHEAMRAVAATGPWADLLRRRNPALAPFPTPEQLYDGLRPLCERVDVWRTTYHHPLASHWDIVEWVKGTGLRPFIDPLGNEEREGFLARYHERLKDEYPLTADGGVLLRYPRLFLVAVR